MEKISLFFAPKQERIALFFLSSEYEEKDTIPRMKAVPTKAIIKNKSIPRHAADIKSNNVEEIVTALDSTLYGEGIDEIISPTLSLSLLSFKNKRYE